jgi:hypothetical protein
MPASPLRQLPFLCAAVGVLFAGGVVRAALVTQHFSHTDDALVPLYLGHAREEPMDAQLARALIADPEAGAYVASVRPLVERLDALGLLDPIAAVANACWPYVVMAVHSTYAPGQFVATAVLVSGSEPYSQAKTLARAPSLVFGLLGVALSALFVLRLRGVSAWPGALTAAAVVACSVQHVAYSVHASSYAATVVAVYAVLFLLDWNVSVPSLSASRAAVAAAALVCAFYLGYHSLPFLAGWLGAMLFAWWRGFPGRRLRVAATLAAVGASVALAFLPAYAVTFMHKSGRHWNVGPQGEFLFQAPERVWDALVYSVGFFAGNGWLVFRSQTAFFPEGSAAYWLASVALGVTAALGIRTLLVSRSPGCRALLVCLAVVAAVVVAMCIARRLTLSPTRHTMFLLPVLATAIGFGADAVVRSLRFRPRGAALAILAYVGLFLLQAPRLVAERRDPFDEAEIVDAVEEHGVTALVAYEWTDQIALMPSVQRSTAVFNDRRRVYSRSPETVPALQELETVAFVSHRAPLSRESFTRALAGARRQKPRDYAGPAWEQCDVIHRQERRSDVEVEYSRRTRSGSNNLFLTICRLMPREQGRTPR